MVRQTLKTKAIHQLVDGCFKKYPNGLVTNVQRGNVPSEYQSLARYVAKYVVSPPIAVRRIDRYDGARVTYHYRSHRTERVEHETADVATFIGRMVQHMVVYLYRAGNAVACKSGKIRDCSESTGLPPEDVYRKVRVRTFELGGQHD